MAATIRLDAELERLVADAARRLKVTRSEVIRRSIRDYCQRILAETDVYPWELMKDLVGCVNSGIPDLARNSRKYVMEMIRAKDEKRRRRAG